MARCGHAAVAVDLDRRRGVPRDGLVLPALRRFLRHLQLALRIAPAIEHRLRVGGDLAPRLARRVRGGRVRGPARRGRARRTTRCPPRSQGRSPPSPCADTYGGRVSRSWRRPPLAWPALPARAAWCPGPRRPCRRRRGRPTRRIGCSTPRCWPGPACRPGRAAWPAVRRPPVLRPAAGGVVGLGRGVGGIGRLHFGDGLGRRHRVGGRAHVFLLRTGRRRRVGVVGHALVVLPRVDGLREGRREHHQGAGAHEQAGRSVHGASPGIVGRLQHCDGGRASDLRRKRYTLAMEPIEPARPRAARHLPAAQPVHHRRPVRGVLRDHRGRPGQVRGGLHRDLHRRDPRRHRRPRRPHDQHADRVRRAVRLARRPGQLRHGAGAGDVPLGAVVDEARRPDVRQGRLARRVPVRRVRGVAPGALQQPGRARSTSAGSSAWPVPRPRG